MPAAARRAEDRFGNGLAHRWPARGRKSRLNSSGVRLRSVRVSGLRQEAVPPHPGRIAGAAFVFGLALLGGALPTGLAGPPAVAELVNQFDAANYFNIVSNKLYTRQGMNRAPLQLGGTEHDLCRDAIVAEFQRVGLQPYQDCWTYVDTTNNTLVNVCNIIAVKEGVLNPNREIYLVGSHYDSKNNPGADDNATGVACQLEMARIFAPRHFAKTLVFAVFDSEERWEAGTGAHRLGSSRYVAQHQGENIKGMVSVDMIGWQAPSPNDNRAWIRARAEFGALRDDLLTAIQTYGDGLIGAAATSDNLSDNYPFAQAGIPAALFIEYNFANNPNYHKATDYVELPGYLDWAYLEKMCKSVIGYYATQLQPVDVTPRVLSVARGPDGATLVAGAGLPRCQYAVELCTNLASPVWFPLATNTAAATDGTFTILDPQAGHRPGGFYRARFVAGDSGGGGVAPQITTQPLNRVVDPGGAVSFTVTAAGDAPLSYQWVLNGVGIPGATTNAYTIAGAQPADAGDYAVIVNNPSGSVTSRVAALTVYPPHTLAFADDFDTNSSARWLVSQSSADTRVTFHYDYAADGIPSAPHSVGGTTRGVKLEANLTAGVRAAVSLSPVGQNFGGDYRLRFDLWINANGPFPAGGTGSTEYATAGLGTAGGRVQWTGTGSTADGYWFVTDGEGGASDTSTPVDFGAYQDTTLLAANSGVYTAGTNSDARGNVNAYYTTAFPPGRTPPPLQQSTYSQQTGALAGGCVGFAWRDVIIAKRGNLVEWSVDGVKLAAFTNATVAASNIFVGYWDPYPSVSDNAALSFGLVDNVRVEIFTNSPPPPDVILDNPSATVVGTWAAGTSSPDKYGSDYRFKDTKGSGAAYVEFRPNLPASGNYQVFEWHPQGANRTTDAPVEITSNGGPQTVLVNQQINGGTWVWLGTFNFSAGTAGCVRIKDNFTTGSVVLADAVKFVYAP
jgi:hypothetical protein